VAELDLKRVLQQHLDGLRAAGVEYLQPLPAIQLPEPVVETEPSVIDPFEQRKVQLEVLRKEVSKCEKCPELFSTRTQTVFGVGKLSPEVCFVGEAPGADEDKQGEPFVGAAGQLLTKIIQAMGMKREEVYICNTLKCRPPNNATPSPDQCSNCRPYFLKQLELIQPKYICCLGAVASQQVLQRSTGIMKLRGQFYDFNGIPVICTFHPAALLRNPDWKRDVWDDMKTLLRKMGRPIPGEK
jgi:uracil-DNA glycosylase